MSETTITIIRTQHGKENPYFIMSRTVAQNRNLSWAARGILTYLLSKPDDWEVQVGDLQQGCGRDKVYGLLGELEQAGHLKREQTLNANHTFKATVYRVYEHSLPGKPSAPDAPYEPDGTCPYMVENQRGLKLGEDWLGLPPEPHPALPYTENPLTENPQRHNRDSKNSLNIESTDTTHSLEETHKAKDQKDVPPSGVTLPAPKQSLQPTAKAPIVPSSKPVETPAKAAAAPSPSVPRVSPPPTNGAPSASPRAHKRADPMFEAIAFAWNTRDGGYVGIMRKMLEGRCKRKDGDWYHGNVKPAMTPAQIVGFRLWWQHNPKTKELDFPTVPSTIQRRAMEFRGVGNYERIMALAQAKLDDLVARVGTKVVWEPVEPPPPAEPPDETVFGEPNPELMAQFNALVEHFTSPGSGKRL